MQCVLHMQADAKKKSHGKGGDYQAEWDTSSWGAEAWASGARGAEWKQAMCVGMGSCKSLLLAVCSEGFCAVSATYFVGLVIEVSTARAASSLVSEP